MRQDGGLQSGSRIPRRCRRTIFGPPALLLSGLTFLGKLDRGYGWTHVLRSVRDVRSSSQAAPPCVYSGLGKTTQRKRLLPSWNRDRRPSFHIQEASDTGHNMPTRIPMPRGVAKPGSSGGGRPTAVPRNADHSTGKITANRMGSRWNSSSSSQGRGMGKEKVLKNTQEGRRDVIDRVRLNLSRRWMIHNGQATSTHNDHRGL